MILITTFLINASIHKNITVNFLAHIIYFSIFTLWFNRLLNNQQPFCCWNFDVHQIKVFHCIKFNSSSILLPADPIFSISKVKSKLVEFAKTPASGMILQFKDKILNDKRTLDQCGVKNGDELTLKLREGEGGCFDMQSFWENGPKGNKKKNAKREIAKEAMKRNENRLKEYSRKQTEIADVQHYFGQSWHWTGEKKRKIIEIGVKIDAKLDDDWRK